MGDPGVDEVDGEGGIGDREGLGWAPVVGFAHAEADLVAVEGGADDACGGFEGDGIEGPVAEEVGEAGEAAGTVAAHFGFAAVGVVVAHAEVGSGLSGFDGEETVCADAAVAVAQGGDLRAAEGEAAVPVVEDDEVVAGPVHFPEVNHSRS